MPMPFFSHPQALPWFRTLNGQLELTLFVDRHLPLTHVYLRYEPDNEEVLLDMQPCGYQGELAIWQGLLPVRPCDSQLRYCFKALTADGQWWLHGGGVSTAMPPRTTHFRYNPQHKPPFWVQDQVFYQIFPDRFCNGDPSLSVTTGEYRYGRRQELVRSKTWGEPVASDAQHGAASEFYGGDLAGIEQKLHYLNSLGISALYLNPIFASPSNHKYDTVDFYTVDAHLGSNQQLADLVSHLHQRGMRLVLDAVVDHTSDQHPWFTRDRASCQASQNPAASRFYTFDAQGNHVGWKGFTHLPKLDFASPVVQDVVYRRDDAILRHWLRAPYAIDGWRFDVIHMLGEHGTAEGNRYHVQQIRQCVKEENPDAYVLGEHFFEASDWLQGDLEDGAMNYYGFAHPVRAFLAGRDMANHPVRISAEEFAQWLDEARANLPFANQLAQLNLLDSHDTARFLSLLGGDRALMRMAVALLFTYIGVPCIYYGDEVGMEGGNDPDCRRCFPWDSTEWDHLLHDHYRRMIRLRKTHPALRRGDFHTLYAGAHSYVFARTLESDVVITALNRHPDNPRTITLPIWQTGSLASRFTDPETREKFEMVRGEVQITLPPKGVRLLLAS